MFDPYAYETHEDPYPLYARLREEAPLYHNPDQGFWALSRHADVMDAFRDSTRFSSAEGVSLDPAATGPKAHKTMSFLAMDPPRHGRMRALVSRGFTPRRVAALEPRIRALTLEHLEAAVASREFDFIGQFAGKLPMDVISELVGVPPADRDEVRRLADLLVHREDGVMDIPPAGVEAALELVVYYSEMLAERRRRRTEDLTSALLDVEVDGDRLTDEEIISFLFLLVVAGNETTTKLLGNAWYWAARFPDERRRALADPGAVAGWAEETLRYDTSTQLLARTTTCDVDVAGGTIPEGERVVLLVGSANRDPRVFAEPDRYDVGRFGPDGSGSQGLLASFGVGRHFCMGASLARLEARIALEELVHRVGDYEVDVEAAVRVHSVNVRGFASLPTSVQAR
ncbi:MAG: cytochrome P450 [Acidimicrobiia bacterium]|nr:cytochrome P450 [Acidimicrobiia bacterium]